MLLSAMAAVLGNFIFAVPITVIGTNYDRLYHEMVRERILNALLQSVRKYLQLEAHNRAELMKEKKGRIMLSSAFLLLGYSPSRTKAARVTTLNRALLRDLLYAPIKGRKRQLADYAEVWEKIVAAWAALYPDEDGLGEADPEDGRDAAAEGGRWAAVADAGSTPTATASPTRSPATCGTTKRPSRWATTASRCCRASTCQHQLVAVAAVPARVQCGRGTGDRAADLKWCEGAAQALPKVARRSRRMVAT